MLEQMLSMQVHSCYVKIRLPVEHFTAMQAAFFLRKKRILIVTCLWNTGFCGNHSSSKPFPASSSFNICWPSIQLFILKFLPFFNFENSTWPLLHLYLQESPKGLRNISTKIIHLKLPILYFNHSMIFSQAFALSPPLEVERIRLGNLLDDNQWK